MVTTILPDADAVEVMAELRATQDEPIASNRQITVSLSTYGNDTASSIVVAHGSNKNALTITLNRTVRVPDNRDTNSLPPGLGQFPLFKVRDYAHKMPEDMARKGGVFFPMYQREAMWVNFSAQVPFALKLYVGGVNAVSGFPMVENEKTKEKRMKMLNSGKQIQDYMVVPGQNWLDGIVSEDGKIRQFVAKPKGSGFSVEAQVTGEEKVGGIQVEIIPMKRNLPTEFDVRYEDKQQKVITRTLKLAERGITSDSTWLDVKKIVRDEFDIALKEQSLSKYPPDTTNRIDFSESTKLGDIYFPANFSTVGVQHVVNNPPPKARIASRFLMSEQAALDDEMEESEGEDMGFGCDFDSYSCEMAAPMAVPMAAASILDASMASMGAQEQLVPQYTGFAPSAGSAAPPPPPPASAPMPIMKESSRRSRDRERSVPAKKSAPAPPKVKEMGLAAGGFIQQTITPDPNPADIWDIAASVMMNLQILDVESFCAVTGQPSPSTPVDAASYANYGYPFFEIWGEEKSGVVGQFAEVKSVAEIEAERARANGQEVTEEESVAVRVIKLGLGPFRSTFRPVELLEKELKAMTIDA